MAKRMLLVAMFLCSILACGHSYEYEHLHFVGPSPFPCLETLPQGTMFAVGDYYSVGYKGHLVGLADKNKKILCWVSEDR